jgi:hypothetical protein
MARRPHSSMTGRIVAKTPKIQAGKKAARAIFEDALASIDEQTQRRDPDPNLLRNGIKAGTWEAFRMTICHLTARSPCSA